DNHLGIPIEFALDQNYPNPFNQSTIINYQLPNHSKVTLIVYDILGREIATLVNEEKPAGRYEVQFDGSNLTSGVYIYRLVTSNGTLSKKFILLK
ncbi:MAG: T9SS type A sorting domain-containing protein, partial [Calditrichia bacterium]|nr:T9SS type A sorting domain-containing protein [Calditrichia bacterium]